MFEAVARHCSFSRAVEELHLIQTAVPTQVKTLEGHVGLALFEQLGKKIYLNQGGTELPGRARLVIRQFPEADEALAHFKGIAGGTFNVALISASDYFFPHLLVAFVRRHPGVKLRLTVHNREELTG